MTTTLDPIPSEVLADFICLLLDLPENRRRIIYKLSLLWLFRFSDLIYIMGSKTKKAKLAKVVHEMRQQHLDHLWNEMTETTTIRHTNKYSRRRLEHDTHINNTHEYDRLIGDLSQTNAPI